MVKNANRLAVGGRRSTGEERTPLSTLFPRFLARRPVPGPRSSMPWPKFPPRSTKPADKPEPAGRPADKSEAALITRGVSVRVLNAARSRSTTLGVVGRLRRAGLDVAVIAPAAVRYRRTTVLWSRAASRPRLRWQALRVEGRAQAAQPVPVGDDARGRGRRRDARRPLTAATKRVPGAGFEPARPEGQWFLGP